MTVTHPNGQMTLDQAIAAAEHGQRIAADNAGPHWATQVDRHIHDYLTKVPELHTDRFWDYLEQCGIEFRGRAIGARYKAAAKRGWMTKTDRVKPSVRSHGTGKPVWKSNIYKEPF